MRTLETQINDDIVQLQGQKAWLGTFPYSS
jgi:hypothetical protein